MNRAQILYLQSLIALIGGGLWLAPPRYPNSTWVVAISLTWALLGFLAIFWPALEDWTYRASSFFGFFLCTTEGLLSLMGATSQKWMLPLALLHGLAFMLAVIGKYQNRARSRPPSSFERLRQEMTKQER